MNPEDKVSHSKADKERLAFTVYNILKQFDPNKKGFVSLTRFNKISYLVHKDVKEKLGINTGLPWHWYLFGPVTELSACPKETYELRSFGEEQRVFYHQIPSARNLPEEEKKAILSIIEDWREKYLKTPELVDLVYDDLEIGFLKELKELDRVITSKDEGSLPMDVLMSRLDSIRNLFPEEEYERSLPIFLKLDELTRVVLESDPEYLRSNQWMISDFRMAIVQKAAAMRFENLARDWESNQLEKYNSSLDEYEERLSEVEREIYTKVYKKSEDRHGYVRKLMEVSWDSCWEE